MHRIAVLDTQLLLEVAAAVAPMRTVELLSLTVDTAARARRVKLNPPVAGWLVRERELAEAASAEKASVMVPRRTTSPTLPTNLLLPKGIPEAKRQARHEEEAQFVAAAAVKLPNLRVGVAPGLEPKVARLAAAERTVTETDPVAAPLVATRELMPMPSLLKEAVLVVLNRERVSATEILVLLEIIVLPRMTVSETHCKTSTAVEPKREERDR